MKKSWILLILILLAVSGCVSSKNPATNQWLKGTEATAKGEYSDAVAYHKRATELESQEGLYSLYLCKAYYDNDQYQEAVDVCKKTLNFYQKYPGNKTGESIWSFIVAAYDKLGQIDSAISSQKRWIELELSPDNSDSFVTLARLYHKNKQYDEAITAGKRAIELKSDNAGAYNALGAAYGRKKQYDEAIKALKKAIEIDPANALYRKQMGDLFIDKEDYAEAIEGYKKAVELQPANINYLISIANTYRVMGRYDDAIASGNKAIELQTITGIGITIDVKSGYTVIKGVMNNGPAKKADILAGDKIIKIHGKSTKGWNLEQVVQSLRGASGTQVVFTIERKGAEKTIDKTVTRETIIAKEAALSVGLRSLAYRHKGSLEAALKDAEKACSLDAANGWAQLSLGAAYLDRGKYDESIKLLSQIKVSSMARLLEATAYAKQGKAKEAATIYLSIPEEKISPKNIPLMNDRMALLQTFKPIVKEHRDKARSFESKGQYKEALSELSEALKIADDTEVQDIQETIFSMIRRNPLLAEFSEMPEDARKYALRSEVLVKEGNFEQAVTEIKKAIQIAPYAAQLYYNSALWNAELKKYSEAIQNMKIYLKAAPDAPNSRAVKDEIIKWEFMMEKGK